MLDDEFGCQTGAAKFILPVTFLDGQRLSILEPLDFAAFLADLDLQDKLINLFAIIRQITRLILKAFCEEQWQSWKTTLQNTKLEIPTEASTRKIPEYK